LSLNKRIGLICDVAVVVVVIDDASIFGLTFNLYLHKLTGNGAKSLGVFNSKSKFLLADSIFFIMKN
jgi:hypothetical protein